MQVVPPCTICLETAAALKRLSAPGVVVAHAFTQEMVMRRYSTAAGAHLLALYLPFHTHAIPSKCLTDILGPFLHACPGSLCTLCSDIIVYLNIAPV